MQAVSRLARETDAEFVHRRDWQYCPWVGLDVPTNYQLTVMPPSALEARIYHVPNNVEFDPEGPTRAEEPIGGSHSPDPEMPRGQ